MIALMYVCTINEDGLAICHINCHVHSSYTDSAMRLDNLLVYGRLALVNNECQ